MTARRVLSRGSSTVFASATTITSLSFFGRLVAMMSLVRSRSSARNGASSRPTTATRMPGLIPQLVETSAGIADLEGPLLRVAAQDESDGSTLPLHREHARLGRGQLQVGPRG